MPSVSILVCSDFLSVVGSSRRCLLVPFRVLYIKEWSWARFIQTCAASPSPTGRLVSFPGCDDLDGYRAADIRCDVATYDVLHVGTGEIYSSLDKFYLAA